MKANVPQTSIVILICALAFGILQHAASAADERETLQALSKSFTVLAQEVGEVVVGIKAQQSYENREGFSLEELRRWFRENPDRRERQEDYFFSPDPNRERQERRRDVIPPPEVRRPNTIQPRINFGSGILLDEQGHIATVIELVNDSKEITITPQGGAQLEAKVIAADKATGIAVLKIDTAARTMPKFGDSDDVAIGELMVALGHTVDQEPAISLGMISGVGRNPHMVDYENWLAIDANLRPGSGGGAIVNAKGEIIGMTAGSPSEGAFANAFAIPINTVRQIATELIERGKVTRGWLGVSIQDIDPSMAEKLGLDKPMGVLINRVFDNTPAAEFGLQRGDVITAINAETIKGVNHLRAAIAMYKPMTTVLISILRDGQTQDIEVTLSERSAQALRPVKDSEGHVEPFWKGLAVQNLTADLAEKLRHTADEGVLIADVAPNSAAAKAGVRKGDLILEVENQPIHNVAEFKSAVAKVEGEAKILLLVKHEGQARYITVE